MFKLPRFSDNFPDLKLNQVFRDILNSLQSVLDLNTYTVESKYTVPFDFRVPTFGGLPRLQTPDVVQCVRATPTDDPLTPVHLGATQWTWIGNGQVRVNDVAGLVVGCNYRLVFKVVN